MNTYSNLSYAIAALFIAWSVDTKWSPSSCSEDNWWHSSAHFNLMTQSRYFTMSFCLILTNISYSSAFLHAGWTSWGDKLDSISFLLMFLWLIIASVVKFWLMCAGWTTDRVVLASEIHGITCVFLATVLYGYYFGIEQNLNVQFYLKHSIVLAVILEIIIRYGYSYFGSKDSSTGTKRTSTAWIGWMAMLIFVVALVIQMNSLSGSSLCNPDSLVLQGHAAWHVLSAICVVWCFFFHLSDKFDEDDDEGGASTAKTPSIQEATSSNVGKIELDIGFAMDDSREVEGEEELDDEELPVGI